MSISPARARSLCTRAELSLVKASTRNLIGKLSPAQLKVKMRQAMRLRDKWGDLARGQRRKTQATRRSRLTAGVNVRSAEKAALFAEVLERFQSRAQTIEKQPQQQKPSRAKAARARRTSAAPAATPRTQRRKQRAELATLAAARGRKSLKTDRRTPSAATTASNRRNQARRGARR